MLRTRVNRPRSTAAMSALLAAAFLPLAACGSGGGTGDGGGVGVAGGGASTASATGGPGGTATLVLSSGESIDIFIPDGWSEWDSPNPPLDDSDSVNMSLVPQDEIARPSVLVSVTAGASEPCDEAQNIAQIVTNSGDASRNQPFPAGLGLDPVYRESAFTPSSPWTDVRVVSVVPVSGGNCSIVTFGAGQSSNDAAAAAEYQDRMRPVVKSVASNSTAEA